MRPVSLIQDYNPRLQAEEIPSRPPDAAIRANAEIMRASAETMARMMAGSAASGGLNIVINGSNPGVPRTPERISGQNGELLAAAALAAETESAEEIPVKEALPEIAKDATPKEAAVID